jgi:hypothetical protein
MNFSKEFVMESVFIATGSTGKPEKVFADESTINHWVKCNGWYTTAMVGKSMHYHYAGGRFAGMITPFVVHGVYDMPPWKEN